MELMSWVFSVNDSTEKSIYYKSKELSSLYIERCFYPVVVRRSSALIASQRSARPEILKLSNVTTTFSSDLNCHVTSQPHSHMILTVTWRHNYILKWFNLSRDVTTTFPSYSKCHVTSQLHCDSNWHLSKNRFRKIGSARSYCGELPPTDTCI